MQWISLDYQDNEHPLDGLTSSPVVPPRLFRWQEKLLQAFKINGAIPVNEDDKSVRKLPSFTALQSQMENYQTVDRWLTGAG